MEQSYTIDKIGWYTQTPGNPEPKEHIHQRFRVIIDFLQNRGLTVREIWPVNQSLTDDTSIHTSHLTEDGRELVKLCYHKWLQGLDKGQSLQLGRWEKALVKLKSHHNR